MPPPPKESRFFPYLAAGEARRYSRHSRIEVFFTREGSVALKEQVKLRKYVVHPRLRQRRASEHHKTYYLAVPDINAADLNNYPGYQRINHADLVHAIWTSETQAAAYTLLRIDIPDSGFPLSLIDLVAAMKEHPRLEATIKSFEKKWRKPSIGHIIPLPLHAPADVRMGPDHWEHGPPSPPPMNELVPPFEEDVEMWDAAAAEARAVEDARNNLAAFAARVAQHAAAQAALEASAGDISDTDSSDSEEEDDAAPGAGMIMAAPAIPAIAEGEAPPPYVPHPNAEAGPSCTHIPHPIAQAGPSRAHQAPLDDDEEDEGEDADDEGSEYGEEAPPPPYTAAATADDEEAAFNN